ncbi:hypothetical protein SAY86_028388 [Trapa natans]|uniref:C2H2-type domain-containing protein n=1 Tax=Trapa natans TaxID=22666 RepID=A0AAN7M128_TRANT|nr:hypothetical protein SAY86_028388 [Trapa natans]
MPTVWFALKRSLHCKSGPSDVHNPKTRRQLAAISTSRKLTRSGCSRSIANLKDVIHGSSRPHTDNEMPPSCSPRSIGSSEFLNPITHEVILDAGNSRCELKITSFSYGCGSGTGQREASLSLAPGTPMHCFNNPSFRASSADGGSNCSSPPPRKFPAFGLAMDSEGHKGKSATAFGGRGEVGVGSSNSKVALLNRDDSCSNGVPIICNKCGEQFCKWEAAEAHHLSKHAVTELVEGDSSRRIVEMICRTGWLKSDPNSARIDRILKIINMQKTLARFEEYREAVKLKASKLPKKHPRCLADGNELLRFYATTLSCSLGLKGCSSICASEKCSVCRIIRSGFSTKKEMRGGVGVFTTSTSGRALQSIEAAADEDVGQEFLQVRKALIVCRVIAGRVHKPLENIQEINGQNGFDSLAGKVGLYSHIEELYLLNPKALLPCFVVICK